MGKVKNIVIDIMNSHKSQTMIQMEQLWQNGTPVFDTGKSYSKDQIKRACSYFNIGYDKFEETKEIRYLDRTYQFKEKNNEFLCYNTLG